jgi:VWFA-related protein
MFQKLLAAFLCAGLVAVFPVNALPARPARAQEPLHLDVNLVNVFATVQSPRGEFVTGLTASDFRVYDDDVEQKISIFEKDDQVESAIGVLVDNSGSMVDILPIMKTGVLSFAQKARRSDEFFVMTFGIHAQVVLDIHRSIDDLDAAFKSVTAKGTSVLFDALIDGMTRVGKSERERKALVVFTDGNDNGSTAGFGEVSHLAQRSSVLLYFVPIGARVHIDQPTVEALAAQSGGRVIYLEKSDPIRPAMDSIRSDLAKQYYLGYYVPPRPGNHRIRVELPGRDVRLRYKTGYLGNG